MGIGPDLICQPGLSPGIKMHSFPAAFPTTLSLSFVPFPSHLPAPPPHASDRAELHLLPCQGPSPPQNRYDATSRKMLRRDGWLSFARRLGSIVSSTVRPVRRSLTTTPMKRPAFQQVAGDFGHATALDAEPLLPVLRASSTNSSHLLTSLPWSTKARVSTLTGCVIAASSYCRSP